MNTPKFVVFPEKVSGHASTYLGEPEQRERLTGQFVWHYQDGNGRLTHDGGEAFTRREDAHRSIKGVAYDYAILFGHTPAAAKVLAEKVTIVDLDENGDVIEPEPKDD
jgi:hypothetical protein